MEPIATRLKRLREAASPSLSIRQLAAILGMDHSTYVFYERADRFKKPHLPIDFARKLATVLADHGIDPNDVMELAGVGQEEVTPIGLTANEEQLLDHFRGLCDDQRRLLLELADAMGKAATAPQPERPTVHTPKGDYRTRASR